MIADCGPTPIDINDIMIDEKILFKLKQMCNSACAYTKSDQRLVCSHSRIYTTLDSISEISSLWLFSVAETGFSRDMLI